MKLLHHLLFHSCYTNTYFYLYFYYIICINQIIFNVKLLGGFIGQLSKSQTMLAFTILVALLFCFKLKGCYWIVFLFRIQNVLSGRILDLNKPSDFQATAKSLPFKKNKQCTKCWFMSKCILKTIITKNVFTEKIT